MTFSCCVSWPGITINAFKTWKKRIHAGRNIDDGHHFKTREVQSRIHLEELQPPKQEDFPKLPTSEKIKEAATVLDVSAEYLSEVMDFIGRKRKIGRCLDYMYRQDFLIKYFRKCWWWFIRENKTATSHSFVKSNRRDNPYLPLPLSPPFPLCPYPIAPLPHLPLCTFAPWPLCPCPSPFALSPWPLPPDPSPLPMPPGLSPLALAPGLCPVALAPSPLAPGPWPQAFAA